MSQAQRTFTDLGVKRVDLALVVLEVAVGGHEVVARHGQLGLDLGRVVLGGGQDLGGRLLVLLASVLDLAQLVLQPVDLGALGLGRQPLLQLLLDFLATQPRRFGPLGLQIGDAALQLLLQVLVLGLH